MLWLGSVYEIIICKIMDFMSEIFQNYASKRIFGSIFFFKLREFIMQEFLKSDITSGGDRLSVYFTVIR